MQALPMILTIGSGLVKGAGALAAGAQNKRALYGQAHEEELAAAEQELRIRETARKAIGEQIAGQFSNGFQGGTGSALEALTESQVNMTLDALRVRRAGMAKAMSLRAEGDMRKRQGVFDAVGAVLGTAGDVMGMKGDWAQAKRPS